MTCTRPLAPAATLRISRSVSSVLPSLTATISSFAAGYCSASRLLSESAIAASSLKPGITIATRGSSLASFAGR